MRQRKRQKTRKTKGNVLTRISISLGLILGLLMLGSYITGQAVSSLHFDQKKEIDKEVHNLDEATEIEQENSNEKKDTEKNNSQKEVDGFDENKQENNKQQENKGDPQENSLNQDIKENDDITEKKQAEKIVYLTFDDGPTEKITLQIIDVLDQYNVKGTFFILGSLAEKNPEIIKELDKKGHLVANHTYSHNYKYLYSATNNLLGEVEKTQQIVEGILGKDMPKIMRFPGGSFGKKLEPFRQTMVKNGYKFYDWNVLNGDAEGKNRTKSELVDRVKETNLNHNQAIVLMHDSNTKQTTVDALPEIIEYFIKEGYTFDTLDNYIE